MRPRLTVPLIALLIVAAAGLYAVRFADQAAIGAAAVAQFTCSCVFVSGRELGACRADQPAGFEQVAAEIDAADNSVTGRVFGLVTRRAIYTKRYGCMLEP
jgi:hypothetical protein